ncbi:MAG TPA: DNA gyrase subunit A [Nitrospiria bacterium]|nr:DNA gyrase subunit A [Nitrospiria bacterium]
MTTETRKIVVDIEDEMKTSYLDYAMSVIVGRALPDVRDGLKPVHRRILYGMHEMGLLHNRPYRKSAKVTGEIMGNYHPHGDAAIYDTLVRMAQDFNMRYLLIDGQGNFGSIDGDPPAAMRYTESRLTQLAEEMLADIDKDTVDFVPNYDESRTEPTVLPSKIPNLLINGSSGIAVGMATNIPTHNLTEVIDALTLMIDNPEAGLDKVMRIVKGPDFPTGGFICGTQGIKDAYKTGRGILTLRGKATIEVHPKTEKETIIITELPYQVNKARLIEKIAELVRDRKVDGISDVRDESDRDGMRIVVELRRGEVAAVILNQLYKHTQLQTTFGVIMLALIENQPRVLNLAEILQAFVRHRRNVVVRRTQYELKKAEEKAHILEGLKIALDHLDQVIALIRRAASPEVARTGLVQQFGLSQVQAQAILDMRLQRLTQLEREKLVTEYQETIKRIEYLRSVLGSEALVRKIIKDELLEIREKYQDARRTEIMAAAEEIDLEDLIAEEDMVITITNTGYIKRNPVGIYRSQRRGGKGKIGMGVREEDFVEHLFVASTHDYLLFFTDAGKVYWQKVHQIPEAGRATKGKAIVNLLQLAQGEKITAILPVDEFREDRYVVMATRQGVIKKTPLQAYSNPRAGGIIALTLEPGDKLVAARLTDGVKEVLIGTKKGLVIRFPEKQARPMGRAAVGVKGITLAEDNEVIGMEVLDKGTGASVLTVTERGFGKRTDPTEYRSQGRGGKGIISIRTTPKNGNAVAVLQVMEDGEIMMMTAEGKIIRLRIRDIRQIGRNTQGVRLIGLDPNDRVVGVTTLAEKADSEDVSDEPASQKGQEGDGPSA